MVLGEDGYSFWKEKLNSARFVLAPMVDQSELAWRILSRRHGAQLCYTPMLHASVFVKDLRYRNDNLMSCTCDEDRPLIVQFCANDADTLLEAAFLAQENCEAVDLNLGCPQSIARRGHYGAFLEDDWLLIAEMVSRAHKELKIPITCKIRVFKDVERTVKYAQMLEASGCKLLTVHGRTKEQKGPYTGLANWDHIKAVKENVKIPVFANGNIQCLRDVENCMKHTGVNGVMIAEGSLHNPALFQGINPPVWEMALEYLNLVTNYPCSMSYVRGHLFKLCHHCLVLQENYDIRKSFAEAKTVEEFTQTVQVLKLRYEKNIVCTWKSCINSISKLPPWICQPYVRPLPQSDVQSINQTVIQSDQSQKRFTSDNVQISKKKMKKMMKCPTKFSAEKQIYEKCSICSNPRGTKCMFGLCKSCCKIKSFSETLDCAGHGFRFHTKNRLKLQVDENNKEMRKSNTNSEISSDDSFSLSKPTYS